jgi:hypothetical protein
LTYANEALGFVSHAPRIDGAPGMWSPAGTCKTSQPCNDEKHVSKISALYSLSKHHEERVPQKAIG